MPGGRYRFWLSLLLCLLLLGIWHERGEARPVIVLLSPEEDAYFFPFLEVFLRRTLPGKQIVLLHPGDAFPPSSEYIVVAFPKVLERFKPPQGKVWGILLGEGEGVPFPLLGRVMFSWEDVAQALCRALCPGGRVNASFVGDGDHPLWRYFLELCGDGSAQKRVVFVERASQARPFFEEEGKWSFSLIVLEATTELLFALQEGKIDGVVDLKPSLVAQCIVEIVEQRARVCIVSPLFITRENISLADAYEVVRRCFSCH